MLPVEDAWKPRAAFMPFLFRAESASDEIFRAIFLSILLLILLSPSIQSTSWYANIGSWEINRHSETLNFELQDYCIGNITEISATPQGRMVKGSHSSYIDIDLNDVGVKQRRSAFQGEIKSEKYTKLSAEAEEPVIREILKPSGNPFYEFNFTEVWPVHFQSDEAVIYRGTEINDRDLSMNNRDFVSVSFIYATELSAVKRCKMEFSRANITLFADDTDVISVEFLPTKHLNYSIEAFSSGMTNLEYRQKAPDMVTTINKGDQSFFGDYALNASISMGATNKKYDRDLHLQGCSLQGLWDCGPMPGLIWSQG